MTDNMHTPDPNNIWTRQTRSADETKALGSALAAWVQPGDVVVLTGDLGAGKTQFVQGLAFALGVTSAVTSPTFNILLEYKEGALPLYHFDLYRLEEPDELEDIDYYAFVDGDSDGIALIEWGDKFPGELPDDYLHIALTSSVDETRTLRVEPHGARAHEVSRAWMQTL